ncbi:unnamed protein product [Linum trigynum]|uniref:histidine kinase n=1 Tax=Linum trigynum TaxID=586398 RepID=A0AAV2F4F5_9ROSI
MAKKFRSLVVSRPISVSIVVGIGVLFIPSLAIGYWYQKTNHVEDMVEANSNNFHSGLMSQIEQTAKLLQQFNSPAMHLASMMRSTLNATHFSPPEVQARVAPLLFQAFSALPYISQIAYVGLDGPFFSYYYEGNQSSAMYYMGNAVYKQQVDSNTGKLYGNAKKSSFPIAAVRRWAREALSSSNQQHALLGKGWNSSAEDEDLLFITMVGVHRKAIVLLGISAEALMHFFANIDLHGGKLQLATRDGNQVLVDGIPESRIAASNSNSISIAVAGNNVTCILGAGKLTVPSVLNIGQQEYKVYCSSIEVVGVESVYALAFPNDEPQGSAAVRRGRSFAFGLLMIMIAAVFISIFGFLLLIARAEIRETQLCRGLIKQMEATQQAERKSLKKSLAFATASHEIRNLLTPIVGFIQDCNEDLPPDLATETNLKAIHASTKDLVGFLNAILDTSKLEEGKMQLEEEEFEVAEVLEDVVNLFHPMAMEKGVDLVLDLSDVSILKFGHVKGDRGKLKQVLWNLVSNAVKYTDEGQIVVEARAQQPSLESRIIASHPDGCSKWVSKLLKWNLGEEGTNMEDDVSTVKQMIPNGMEFVFEVDDSGKGIPKDKQKSIFENYVQVKETSKGQVGTGLGLGIVQSLVRLMGGEIGIVDKKDEKGTCFRFNTILTVTETTNYHNNNTRDIETSVDESTEDGNPRNQYYYDTGLTIRTSTAAPGLVNCNPSPRLTTMFVPSPRSDESHVVLMIKNEARRAAAQKLMDKLGIKVSVVEQWENLQPLLRKIKSKQSYSPHSSSGKSELGSRSVNSSSGRSKEFPLSAMKDLDERLTSSHKGKTVSRIGSGGFVMLVIDVSAGPFHELQQVVTEFRRGIHSSSFKVVWIDTPNSRRVDKDLTDPSDEILLKPFHGSCLNEVIKYLPKFEGTTMLSKNPAKARQQHQPRDSFEDWRSSAAAARHQMIITPRVGAGRSEIEEEHDDDVGKPLTRDKKLRLDGLTFLVVDDQATIRLISVSSLSKRGAKCEQCENGLQAVECFRAGMEQQARSGATTLVPPYDCIIMDCEMDKMNGCEATRIIREEERQYGIHTPIIGLTGHTSKQELDRLVEAGMDSHLTKPFNCDDILVAMRRIRGSPW